jgi:hypothetical protein
MENLLSIFFRLIAIYFAIKIIILGIGDLQEVHKKDK